MRRNALLKHLLATALVPVALTGCLTVQNSKVLTVQPTGGPVTVTSTARAQCRDLFLILTCKLYMEMQSSNGDTVSDFPAK
jgi:hypothetical protein